MLKFNVWKTKCTYCVFLKKTEHYSLHWWLLSIDSPTMNASGGEVDSLWRPAKEGVCGGQALNRTEYLDLTQVDAVRSAIGVAYALVAALGVCGNAALISIILSRRYLHTASNWSLFSSPFLLSTR